MSRFSDRMLPIRFACLSILMLAPACDKPAPTTPTKPVEAPAVVADVPDAEPPALTPPAATDEAAEEEDLNAEAPEQDPGSPNVKIRIDVVPRSARPVVFWGRQKLGEPPVTIERPRRSGPMDVLITATGYLDYHTRLFTDRDDKLSVVMVRATEAGNMLGYKRRPDAGVGEGSDAGAPVHRASQATADAGAPASPGFVVPQGVSF